MAAFELDGRKLKRALNEPTSALEDLKWTGAALGLGLGVIAWLALVALVLLRALL